MLKNLKNNKERLRSLSFLLIFTFSFFFSYEIVHANGLVRAGSNLGLVGYWSFNEGSGTLVGDFSGNRNTGILQGEATFSNGKFGKGLSLNGTAQTRAVADDSVSLQNLSQFSNCLWVKLASYTNTNFDFAMELLSKPGTLRVDNSGTVGFFLATSNVYPGVESNFNLSLNQWYFICVTHSAIGVAPILYINGVNVSTNQAGGNGTRTSDAGSAVSIGSAPNEYVYNVNGVMDEVRIYNRVLTAGEILNLYKSGGVTRKQVSNQGLVGYWPLDEGGGTRVSDFSGNRNTGIISGAVFQSGKFGKSLVFDGGDSVSSDTTGPTSLEITSNTYTISAWVKRNTSTSIGQIFRLGAGGAGGGYGLAIGTSADGDVCTVNQIFLTRYQIAGYCFGSFPVDTNWHHLLVTQNTTGITAYIDGVLNDTHPNTGGLSPVNDVSEQFGIGQGTNGMASWDGSIDEMRVYNRVLTADEIQSLYKFKSFAVQTTQKNVVTDGLVAYWPFDGAYVNWGTNQILDASENGRTGQIVSMSTTSSPIVGKNGQALRFNEVGQYIGVNSTVFDFQDNTPFSISLWIKTLATSQVSFLSTLNFGVTGGMSLGMNGVTAGRLDFVLSNSSGVGRIVRNSSTNLNSGDWYHVVATYNGTGSSVGGMRLYINGEPEGVLSTSDSNPGTLTNTTLNIGRLLNGSPNCVGCDIDEVRIYNRVLSETEARRLYQIGK